MVLIRKGSFSTHRLCLCKYTVIVASNYPYAYFQCSLLPESFFIEREITRYSTVPTWPVSSWGWGVMERLFCIFAKFQVMIFYIHAHHIHQIQIETFYSYAWPWLFPNVPCGFLEKIWKLVQYIHVGVLHWMFRYWSYVVKIIWTSNFHQLLFVSHTVWPMPRWCTVAVKSSSINTTDTISYKRTSYNRLCSRDPSTGKDMTFQVNLRRVL